MSDVTRGIALWRAPEEQTRSPVAIFLQKIAGAPLRGLGVCPALELSCIGKMKLRRSVR